MENHQERRYIKRTQKDYTKSFNLQVAQKIEQGRLSTHQACRTYGIQAGQQLFNIKCTSKIN